MQELRYLIKVHHDGISQYIGRKQYSNKSKGHWNCPGTYDAKDPFLLLMAKRYGWSALYFAERATEKLKEEHPDWKYEITIITVQV